MIISCYDGFGRKLKTDYSQVPVTMVGISAASGAATTTNSLNPYLYGSKEYLTTGSANLLDFTARTYDPTLLQLIKDSDGNFIIVETKLTKKSHLSKGQRKANNQVKEGDGTFEVRSEIKEFGLKPGDKIKVKEYKIVYKEE